MPRESQIKEIKTSMSVLVFIRQNIPGDCTLRVLESSVSVLWRVGDVSTWTDGSVSSSESLLMFLLRSHFPRAMSSDAEEPFCHSFSFSVATEQQADIDECYLSCAHTSEGPPEWSPTMNSITQRDKARLVTGRLPPRCTSDGPKLYTAHTIFSQQQQKKKKSSFSPPAPFPPPQLWCVNASTCVRFAGNSEAFKVNTSFTSSSRILSSIIKAESGAICIIPGIRGRPASSSAGHAERTALMKFQEMTFKYVGHLASCKGTGIYSV